MAKLIQTLATGLQLGSVYALVALGYTMVYGTIKLINFAHGDLIMVGGYTLLYTIPMIASMGLSPWIAVVFAVVVCVMIGVLTELLAYRPVRRRGTGMTALITAMAMSLILQNLAQYLLYMTHTMYGATVKSIFPQGSISITLGHQKLSVHGQENCPWQGYESSIRGQGGLQPYGHRGQQNNPGYFCNWLCTGRNSLCHVVLYISQHISGYRVCPGAICICVCRLGRNRFNSGSSGWRICHRNCVFFYHLIYILRNVGCGGVLNVDNGFAVYASRIVGKGKSVKK